MKEAINSYRQTAIHTASRGEILIALYDGALRYGEIARSAIAHGDASSKGPALNALIAIVVELSSTLDHSKAPELCANLQKLYAYFIQRAQQASLYMDVLPLDEVVRHLRGLRESWAQAVRAAPSEAPQPAA